MRINEGGMIEIIRYRLPVYWACALINDDYNGLPYKYECSNGTLWDYCIHFEGNECLLGTTENPEK